MTVNFIVFNSASGSYIYHGSCGENVVHLQADGVDGAAVVMVDAIPSGYFDVDVSKLGDPSQVYAFADVTVQREPSEFEASQPDVIAQRAWSDIVNAERERRMNVGKAFNDIALRGTDRDMTILNNLVIGAQMRIAGGDIATLTTYRDALNIEHELTPPQIVNLWVAGSSYVSALYAASWAIKAMTPVPVDATNDTLWP